jgi:hypothetical protein
MKAREHIDRHPGLVPPGPVRRDITAAWRVVLVVVYAAMGAMALVHWLSPCDAAQYCALAALPGSWLQRLRGYTTAAANTAAARECAAHTNPATQAPDALARAPYITAALQAAWHDGYTQAEQVHYVQGWWAGLRIGFFVALYLGVPLVYAGYWLGRWTLGALGWLA